MYILPGNTEPVTADHCLLISVPPSIPSFSLLTLTESWQFVNRQPYLSKSKSVFIQRKCDPAV